ncbi:MAG: Thiolase [Candidatus Gottesmanbacteria bacterium GW2011_GWA2_44_17]|uniref:Thiolase n=3 Tax=Candidatus Gottesmaniibacteriota TaxID=1752720 RepID=A0A0G1IQL6_9BACT|nr:MAG: Thiolase [Microgenomates group bacterium GW2011_GWC1_43_11]KKT38886.1 MAG: Thiolase [Candidatus Gottesmanbacteria bacterium GW2011_GWB1_44_11c]KKT47455.1 MAG: Thiolase [Candidatus Gottesmanbacteria bacterium GW2011_GWA2_44_17]KKT61248.1 MAG: Thiolase [Candidatus Gottesmanbacteria bacterium GW2011_GWA1_44_24b]
MNISVTGIGITKFGELWGVSPRSMAHEACEAALVDAGLDPSDIDCLIIANMLSGMLGAQEHLGAFFSEELDFFHIPSYKVEGACASGGLAVHTAINSLLGGEYTRVMVLGIEKMTDHKPELVSSALMGAGTNEERLSGLTFPGAYAILAKAHMERYKTTEEQLASVAVKNHYHASLNPKAQFHSLLTVEKVMHSACVADPLRLLDCSPISDGAAAVILQNTENGKRKTEVQIIASQVATDTLGVAQRKSLTTLKATEVAAQKAYRQAHILPKDIQVAEVHDCFTIAEILAMEDLGFFEKGKAAPALVRGETTLGSKQLVVNTSGGLKGCGHPVGATGVKQIVEITQQLRGSAGKRQVNGARIGLTHNVGGSGGTCVVHILKGI